MISCKVCKEDIASLSGHVEHFKLKLQVGLRSQFTCGFANCSVKLVNFVLYEKHVLFHAASPSSPCAQPGCNFKGKSKGAVRVHRFWNHAGSNNAQSSNTDSPTLEENGESLGSDNYAEGGDSVTVHLDNDIPIVNIDQSRAPACNLHVSDSTLGFKLDSYTTLINEATALTASELLGKLESSGVDMDVAKPIVEQTLSDSIMNRLHSPTDGPMRSYYMRRQQYTSRKIFNSVSPVQKSLGLNQDNIQCKYHYVPVKESIKWMMNDDSVYEQYLASRQRRPVLQSDYLTDIHDGTSLMTHSLFMTDPSALQIILYYDDYLHARCTTFPTLKIRPKHHFMEHTKLLILKFGPPARTSTLKFESKHKYFRCEFATKKNTINSTLSMATRPFCT
ncbi:hypothetical protein FOCC_FOCC013138 [Frankliniella occidentalis]|nr:hypothetical protein FOCC_FOCC013138 [Frankliniella occidentalis]